MCVCMCVCVRVCVCERARKRGKASEHARKSERGGERKREKERGGGGGGGNTTNLTHNTQLSLSSKPGNSIGVHSIRIPPATPADWPGRYGPSEASSYGSYVGRTFLDLSLTPQCALIRLWIKEQVAERYCYVAQHVLIQDNRQRCRFYFFFDIRQRFWR
jgi:hypothetical protein